KTRAEKLAVEKARDETAQQRDLAIRAKTLAHRRLNLARDTFQTLIVGVQEKLADRAGTQKLRKELLEEAEKGLEKLVKDLDEGEAIDVRETETLKFWARLQMGDVYKSMSETQKAEAQYRLAVAAAESRLKLDANDADAKADLARVQNKLADVHLRKGQT